MNPNPSAKVKAAVTLERVLIEDSYSFTAFPPCLKDYTDSHHLRYAIEGGGFKTTQEFQDREGGFETIQEFQDRDEAIRHWETQQKYDTDFFVHPERFLICRDKHVIIFPIIITDFNGCWVKIHAKGGSDAHSQVTYQDMWTIFKKIGRNIKYLSSEAKAQRPHGNLLKGTGITPDLQALFLNLGADDTDPMLYKKDVKDLHQLLSSFKLKEVSKAKLTKELQIITDCVDRWISFLSDTCLQDPVPKNWTIFSGTAIDPPYLNHDHVRLIFNYPASWSSTEELRFLANMYKLCLEDNRRTNLVRNNRFQRHLMECNYDNWNDCFLRCKKNTSPSLNDVYHFGKEKFYLDHSGRLIINSFVLFAYNCIKHYDRTAQKSHTQEEILAELHKQFPNFTEVIYEAFFKAVASGYKHPDFSIEQILTERI